MTEITSSSLTVTRISAENILRYERFTLENPDKVTVFRGPNDVGKTTALRLLGMCVKGSNRTVDSREVVHDGAQKGAVVVDLSNGYKLRRSFTQKGEYLTVTDERGHDVPDAQTFLNGLIGEFRDFNPLAWLSLANSDAADDRRNAVALLLHAVGVKLTAEEFKSATGLEPPAGIDFDQNGLVVISTLSAHYGEERKTEKRAAEQKKGAALEARATLPKERPVITAERRTAAETALTDARTAKAQIEARRLQQESHAAAVARLNGARQRETEDQKQIAGDKKLVEEEIARLQQKLVKLDERYAHSVERERGFIIEIESLAASAPPTAEELETVNAAIRHANELSQSLIADEKIIAKFENVDVIEQEANDAAANASILDSTIKTINGDLRTQLLAKAQLPVEDLAIDGDRILVDGHPLQLIAESRQIRIALAIARFLSPKLKVIILDGSERLDAKTFAAFLEETRGDGFRYFAAEVDRNGTALEIISFSEDGTSTAAMAEVA